MVDTLVSGASAAMHAGSSPVLGTWQLGRFLTEPPLVISSSLRLR